MEKAQSVPNMHHKWPYGVFSESYKIQLVLLVSSLQLEDRIDCLNPSGVCYTTNYGHSYVFTLVTGMS